MTASALYALLRGRLKDAGVPNAGFEAGCVLRHTAGLGREELALRGETPCDETPALALLVRREAGEPLQYLLGEWDFMGLPFYVGPGVLIPRAETELLAETALGFLKKLPAPRVLELCTGSGCLAVCAAVFCPRCQVTAADISATALGYAKRNITRHGVENRVSLLKLDMLAGPPDGFPSGFDALLCNPPYIPHAEMSASGGSPLEDSVRRFEPHLALDGGPDGLDFYRASSRWFGLLRPGGRAAFEIGFDQGESVAALFRGAGLSDVRTLRDLSGHPRLVCARRP